ncbi:MAG: UvrD-helicase domain-containing protein [Nitrospira sp.]|nr:UvrD-helicase domain-containing protein [Nitrospira sp.]
MMTHEAGNVVKENLPDSHARHSAVTASGTNVVVTAGAGTGKTSLLIDRILHLLTRGHDRLALTQIVAVTFTNKAASDLKLRMRHRLRLMKELATGRSPEHELHDYEIRSIRTLQETSGLTDEELAAVSDEAMREVERAHIETIHSFAGHLLRLYPVEAGVDPSFQEDDGTRFHEHFNYEWDQWLQRELDASGHRHDAWRRVLVRYGLDDVKQLARALTDELIPTSGIRTSQPAITPHLRSWLATLRDRGCLLRERYHGTLKINRLLDAAVGLLTGVETNGVLRSHDADEAVVLQQTIPTKTKAWTDEDYEEAKGLLKVAQAIAQSGSESLWDAVQLLSPFVAHCRSSFVEKGLVSFNGLLARARDLLRDHPRVRAELKEQYQAIIVDEFQDTDPVQYEIILFLAEAAGSEAREWHRVQPAPGKLFIVGDPKQSIYAFRRADIEAYDTVVRDHVLSPAAKGERYALQGNFRTHAQLLDSVNRCCANVFPSVSVEGLQPLYEPLLPVPSDSLPLPHERMELRLVTLAQEDADAETASRAEADALARWLRDDVLEKESLIVGGRAVPIQPCHVAILFRTFGHLRICLEAFRHHHLPCLADGEKHFYERQEVIDCSLVWRTLMDPRDELAAVGVLRSPYGGCSDVEIESIVQRGFLDNLARESSFARLPPIFTILHSLHAEIRALPVPEAIQYVFQSLPLAELAAASVDGEHALANVLKLRDVMLALAARSGLTLREIVRQVEQWVDDPPDEGERPLVEEGLTSQGPGGAIRLSTIHKAKGLEFPMVVVAGLHRDVDHRKDQVRTSHDWLTNTIGLRLGQAADLGGIFLETKVAERQRAEHVRLLYVAMTRAQRRLVLSAALHGQGTIRKGTLLSFIARGLDLDVPAMVEAAQERSQCDHLVGNVAVTTTVVPAPQPTKKLKPAPPTWKATMPDGTEHQRRWDIWLKQGETVVKTPLFLSATRPLTTGDVALPKPKSPALLEKVPGQSERQSIAPRRKKAVSQPRSSDRSAIVGTLAHRVLHDWDFSADPAAMPSWIEACCNTYLSMEWVQESGDVCAELQEIFAYFVESEPYAVLRQADILGREIPFAVPWKNADTDTEHVPASVMEGVIDVMYRRDQQLWIADYKTHRVESHSVEQVVQDSRAQMKIYRRAAESALAQGPVRTQLIFLRSGLSVEV